MKGVNLGVGGGGNWGGTHTHRGHCLCPYKLLDDVSPGERAGLWHYPLSRRSALPHLFPSSPAIRKRFLLLPVPPPPALGGFGSGKGRHRSGQSGCALWEVMVEARGDFWGLDLLGRLNFCSSNTGCCSNASSPIVWPCSLLSLPTLKIIKNRENCNIFRVF